MEREHITVRVHPEVVKEMNEVKKTMKLQSLGGVIEHMAKLIWATKFLHITPAKYEREADNDSNTK